MLKSIIFVGVLVVMFSCNTQEENKKPIARVYNEYLYQDDLEKIMPRQLAKEDSALFVSSYINDWAKEQLLFQKSKINILGDEKENIDVLVRRYHQDLLVNTYKEGIINQELDTVITARQFKDFYSKNKEIFKLNEELVKLKYIHFGNAILNSKEFIELFKSNTQEADSKIIAKKLQLKSFSLNDSIWIKYTDIAKKVPFFKSLKKDQFLKKNTYFKENDSTGVYLVKVKGVLLRNQIAPMSYAKPIIKQMLLHKRKLELFKKIEETLTEDAIKNKNFQIY